MPILSHSHKEAIVSAPIAALLEALFVMLRVRVDRHLARTRKSWLAFNGHWLRAATAVECAPPASGATRAVPGRQPSASASIETSSPDRRRRGPGFRRLARVGAVAAVAADERRSHVPLS